MGFLLLLFASVLLSYTTHPFCKYETQSIGKSDRQAEKQFERGIFWVTASRWQILCKEDGLSRIHTVALLGRGW